MKTKPEVTHTPTPWTHNPEMSDSSISGPGGVIARAVHSWDAAFIVRAVNNYQPLLDAIMDVCRVIGVNETKLNPFQSEALRRLAKAHDIAKAEGK